MRGEVLFDGRQSIYRLVISFHWVALVHSSNSSSSMEKGKEKEPSPRGRGRGGDTMEEDFSCKRSRVSAADENTDNPICGICFSEDGKGFRGWIDSCDHYFCFVCIMEWSKVESRCPLCKQRFNTIRRPSTTNQRTFIYLPERIVNVPLRDQVWHPHGNQTTVRSDPYSEIKCTECKSSSDENLLLLCDLCDSAAHTYCVGLGNTVPEGDWYCNDCTISRNEHTYSQIDHDCCRQDSKTDDMIPVAATSVSISEIVRDCNSPEPEVDKPSGLSSSVLDKDVSARTTQVTNSSVRTLRRCRNVHSRIRALRENWNAVRSGSLSFSSNSLNSNELSNTRHNSTEIIHDNSSKMQSLDSCSPKITKDNASGACLKGKGSYDVDKAWKMMDIATSAQRARKPKQSLAKVATQLMQNKTKDHLSGKQILPKEASKTKRVQKEAIKASPSCSILESYQFRQKELRGAVSKKIEHQSRQKEVGGVVSERSNKHQSQQKEVGGAVSERNTEQQSRQKEVGGFVSEKKTKYQFQQKEPGGVVSENPKHITIQIAHYKNQHQKASEQTFKCGGRPSASHPSLRPSQIQVDTFHKNAGNTHGSSSISKGRSDDICSIHVVESLPKASDQSYTRSEFRASSGCVEELPPEETREDKSSTKLILRKDEGAKSEVQDLVKLNLKMLCKDKQQLGVDGFKEVARLATHTVLAACGIEHKKSSVRSFPDSVCKHNTQKQQLHMSKLMRNSCRECFYAYVVDIIKSIMIERIAFTRLNG